MASRFFGFLGADPDKLQEQQRAVELSQRFEALDHAVARLEFDATGQLVECNTNAARLLGYSASDILRKGIAGIVEDGRNNPHLSALSSALSSAQQDAMGAKQSSECVLAIEQGRGGRVWVRFTCFAGALNDDMGAGVTALLADVTDTYAEQQEALQWRNSLDQGLGWLELDASGSVLSANTELLELLGCSLMELKGKRYSTLISQKSSENERHREVWRKLQTGQGQSEIIRLLSFDNNTIWVRNSYHPVMSADGVLERIVVMVHEETQEAIRNMRNQSYSNAIDHSQAVIEFSLDGNIIQANTNFLSVMGYSLDEVVGKHHSIFVDPQHRTSHEYAEFWAALRRGEFQSREFRRFAKDGREVWLQATYNPIYDLEGNIVNIVKFATDITHEKTRNSGFEARVTAISRSQAVIEFDMQGKILSANKNFLDVMGYELSDIQGRHHSMFVDASEVSGPEYSNFWKQLNAGEFFSGEFRRIAKNAKDVWIQASYNPIFDADGKPIKVVKFASDVTEQKQAFVEISEVLHALAAGDLTQRVKGHYQADLEQLKDALNNTLERLASFIEQIQEASSQVLLGTTEINAGNEDLSRRTESQASAIEETASTMEQMTAQINESASNALDASQTSSKTEAVAMEGKTIIKNTVTAMEEINESSRKIADIISTVDEIAFQTNLLALNAAVEAARAGEQGRGFAVVAGEVRNLAQRSASSAREISQLINDSAERVERGTRCAIESGETLESIVQHVLQTNGRVSEIAKAASEQRIGIEHINVAICSMDKATQQNSALMEEVASATSNMVQQVQSMQEAVVFFKTR